MHWGEGMPKPHQEGSQPGSILKATESLRLASTFRVCIMDWIKLDDKISWLAVNGLRKALSKKKMARIYSCWNKKKKKMAVEICDGRGLDTVEC